ncbi:MAG: aldose epimerase family protein [Phycisphaerales bacterium]
MPERTDDIILELETIRLTISPSVGASIVSLERCDPRGRWAHVLREMPANAGDASDAASFLMLPWTNRVKDARYRFDGQDHTLIANHSDGTAIHGVARDHAWSLTDRSPITARMIYEHRADESCPFSFGGVARYEIAPDRVEMDLSVTNLSEHAIPAGLGHHPYFHRHLHSDADDLRISMDVSGRYACEGCIPSGEISDDKACELLRSGGPIGNPGLDDVFAGFGGRAVLEWGASGVRMTMSCSEQLGHVVVYTPREQDGSPNEFVCIEPVTMVNDGFNLHDHGQAHTGVRVLAPGETLRTRTSLVFSSID